MTTIQKGIITTDFGASDDTARSVIIQPDGKLVVAGYSNVNGNFNFALVRYNVNGSLDKTFDGDGKVTTALGSSDDQAYSVVIQPDGKLVVAGYSKNASSLTDFALVRYNIDGSLDTTFDGDGKLTTAIGYSDDGASSIILQPDGKLVAAGYGEFYDKYNNPNYMKFALVRYNIDGSLDNPRFDGDGKVTTDFNQEYPGYHYNGSTATSIIVQTDGKLVVAGNENFSLHDSYFYFGIVLMRYNANGSLDAAFGDSGIVTANFAYAKDQANSVIAQANGKLVVAGGYLNDFALVRYNTNGSLDTTFDSDGMVTTDFASSNDQANSLITQADGKLVVAGTSDGYFALARYNVDGSLDASFDSDGKLTTAIGSSDDGASSVILQPDGKLVVAGYSKNASGNSDFALVRYNTNGSLDSSFNGTAIVSNHAPIGTVTINDTTPEQNQVLTVANNLTDADGLGTISYQWKIGTTATATSDTYTVTANDVGKKIAVTASYTDGLGHQESKTSASTSAVTAPTISAVGVTITGNDFSTNEQGDSAIFSVKLNSEPVRDVTVAFISSDTTEGIISNATLTFSSSNWSTVQTFTVTGQNDNEVDGNVAYSINANISTIDVVYKSITVSSLTLTNQDTPVAQVETINGTDNIDILQGTDAPSYMLGKAGDDDMSGGAGNDTLWGSYGNDVLFGENDNDILYGEQDTDYLDGGKGNDTLDGGLGLDTLIGGVGDDTYYLGYDAKDVITDNGLPTDLDTVIMPYQLTSYTLPTGIENGTIAAGTQASGLTGNDSDNTLAGNDGKNKLTGAVGRDSLFGGLGNDVLNGGTGNDKLTGGSGKDSFLLDSALKANIDTITDFKPVDDTITLENLIFTKLTTTGVLNADNFVTATAAIDSNDYLVYNKATGALFYDADGSGAGAGIQIATIGVNLALTAADFVVI